MTRDIALYAPVVSAFFAALSVGAAIYISSASRRAGRVQTLLQVAEWFRMPKLVKARETIYQLDRTQSDRWFNEDFGPQSSEMIAERISDWVAYLDIVSTLVLTKNVATDELIRMYGDSIFRTVYILAPFCIANQNELGDR